MSNFVEKIGEKLHVGGQKKEVEHEPPPQQGPGGGQYPVSGVRQGGGQYPLSGAGAYVSHDGHGGGQYSLSGAGAYEGYGKQQQGYGEGRKKLDEHDEHPPQHGHGGEEQPPLSGAYGGVSEQQGNGGHVEQHRQPPVSGAYGGVDEQPGYKGVEPHGQPPVQQGYGGHVEQPGQPLEQQRYGGHVEQYGQPPHSGGQPLLSGAHGGLGEQHGYGDNAKQPEQPPLSGAYVGPGEQQGYGGHFPVIHVTPAPGSATSVAYAPVEQKGQPPLSGAYGGLGEHGSGAEQGPAGYTGAHGERGVQHGADAPPPPQREGPVDKVKRMIQR